MEPTQQLDHVVPPLRELVAGTTPDQMNDSTPCAKWKVRDLMNHLVYGAAMFAGAFRGEPTHDISTDVPNVVGDDPLTAFDAAVASFQDALGQPGAFERTITLPFGEIPVPEVLRFLAFDLTVHSWDLATATGQSFDPPVELIGEVDDTARTMITPEMRDGDTFAEPAPVTPHLRPIERVVALAGRNPSK